jgi:Arm DNA-binding domain
MTTPVRFTDIAIRNLKPTTVRREIPDPGAAGLYLIIHPSGRKSFALRYRFAGAPRKLTLQAGVSLAVARKLVADAMHELASGHDPGETRKIAKATPLPQSIRSSSLPRNISNANTVSCARPSPARRCCGGWCSRHSAAVR